MQFIKIIFRLISRRLFSENSTTNHKSFEKASQNNYHDIGVDFEKYVVSLFNKDYFRIKNWTGDKIADNGNYAESNKNPDIEFYFQYDSRKYPFAVECKWRQRFVNGEITWAKNYQIDNYNYYSRHNHIPVFVCIGVGGTPKEPDRMFIVPLKEAVYTNLWETSLRKYERNPKHRFSYNYKAKILE